MKTSENLVCNLLMDLTQFGTLICLKIQFKIRRQDTANFEVV